jgi:hypothetical protein
VRALEEFEVRVKYRNYVKHFFIILLYTLYGYKMNDEKYG